MNQRLLTFNYIPLKRLGIPETELVGRDMNILNSYKFLVLCPYPYKLSSTAVRR